MSSNASLLQWLSTFHLDAKIPQIDFQKDDAYYKLADGYVCANILNQISPLYFSDTWLEGITPVPPNGSWRLRVSNLKRILQKIHDYGSDLQSHQFSHNSVLPDVAVIAQNFDPDQICRLIQLILFVAINSDKKEYYIEKIQNLPTQVKHDIKEAIEQLLVRSDDSPRFRASHGTNDLVNNDVDETRLSNNPSSKFNSNFMQGSPIRSTAIKSNSRRNSSQTSADLSRKNESNLDLSTQSALDQNIDDNVDDIRLRLANALAIKDEKSQACYELELAVKQLKFEKDQLMAENSRLLAEKNIDPDKNSLRRQSYTNRQITIGTKSMGAATLISQDLPIKSDDQESQDLILNQNARLKGELAKLKEELIRVETEKEEMRLKSEFLQDELNRISLKLDEFRCKAEMAKRLQDELDELRQISEKVVGYETMKENLVQKINDLKRKLENLEEKNLTHIRKIVELEEENKNLNAASGRVDIYKKQLRESQAKLSQESHRADAAEVELTRLLEKYSSTKRENEKLYETTNQLLKGGSIAKDGKVNDMTDLSARIGSSNDHDALTSISSETIELKERLTRIECENEMLKNKLASKRDISHANLSGMLDSANAKCNKLEGENRQARKKILLLESRLRDYASGTGASTSGQETGGSTSAINIPSVENSSDNILSLMNRVEELQRALFKKEQERLDMEAKFKRNIQKAKDVIRSMNNNQSLSIGSLHQSHLSSASPLNSNSLDETNILRHQLKEREDRIIEMEREFYEFKKLKEIHERLILSAFYGLTTPMQWRNAEKRLERTTITSPPNTTSSSLSHSKSSSHNM